jgi:cyclopropane fatty-acyl-phospholipid synthase-like methyltransferase
MNDGSTDSRICQLISEFKSKFEGGFVYKKKDKNGGKKNYYKLVKDGFNELMDCEYILNLQEDVNFNPMFYDVLKKSVKYFDNDEIKAITFFRDSRLDDPDAEGMKIKTLKEHDRYFDEIETIDGLCVMLAKDFIINMDWNIKPTESRTMIFRSISLQLLNYKTLCCKESLVTHTGNTDSKFWAENGKRSFDIYALNLNLFNKPDILKSPDEFYYSPEWYSNTYHAKGDFYLRGKTYRQVSDKWEKKGYKKRMFEVFDGLKLNGKKGLEIACHWGRTMFWLANKYNIYKYDGFDFSKSAVDWARKVNTDKSLTFKLGDCADFPYNKTYDFITCMDVVEHLPEETYLKMIDQIDEHLKPGGQLILYGGTFPLPEHINIKTKDQLKEDFSRFEFVKELKHDHLLFKKRKVSKMLDHMNKGVQLNYNLDYWDKRYGDIGGEKTVGHKHWNDQEYKEQNKKTFDFLDKYIDMEQRKRVIDFGCGICRFQNYLYYKFSLEHYIGMDIAGAVINENEKNKRGVFYLINDYSSISNDINNIDLIWTAFVLQHVIDDKLLLNYLKEFKKVLNPGGRMIFLETSEYWEGDEIDYMKKRTFDDYKNLLNEAGFQNVEEKGRLKLKGTLNHSLIFVDNEVKE